MRRTLLALCLCATAACSDDASGEDRLIPSTDGQFGALERPEVSGECELSSTCKESCVHSCIPDIQEPMTCPVEPTPRPQRLVGATCVCDAQVCKWL
jgi:hypothetical protein